MAFNGCSIKTLDVIPHSVETIGNAAFTGSFSSVTLGKSVRKLGLAPFLSSASSGRMSVNRGTPPSAYNDITTSDSHWTLYVPTGCKSVYQRTSPWSNFKTIIENSNLVKGDDYNDSPNNPGNDPESGTGETKNYTVNGVSFTMVGVEGGTFQMGSTDGNSDEKPVHSVTLSSFSIGQTEVTQQLWYAVMGQKPTSDGSQWSSTYGLGDQYPAYYVSWNDCQEFITKLNQLTGQHFRLPTEAEWEFAVRGGNSSKGYTYAGSNTIGDVAWYKVNSYDKGSGSPDYGTHAVATKQANELGLYDMIGNVCEWCQDWYNSSYYSSSPSNNPTGPDSGSDRVLRGGSWISSATYCRVAFRDYITPTNRYSILGFRLAL